jgi:2OG-Fe(II) oxygenase superfamily
MAHASVTERPAIRSVDLDASDLSTVRDGIVDLYEERLDVILIRGAFSRASIERVGDELDRRDRDPGWANPNARMPAEDIQVIGTAATPTYSTPQGPTVDAYIEGAHKVQSSATSLFAFDPAEEFRRVLTNLAGGRPVDVPSLSAGANFSPFTVRRLTDGKGIGLHHDYHYPLPVYSDLAPTLDTRTLVSFVVTLRKPVAGGELVVYPVPRDLPNPPKQANGWAWDLPALEERFTSSRFVTDVGDMFVFASGRCLHRVAPVQGPVARITMGGFLALDKSRARVLYWS